MRAVFCFWAVVFALVTGVHSKAADLAIEAKFDFISLPTGVAAQAMLSSRNARTLREKVVNLAKMEQGSRHDLMSVSGASGTHVGKEGIANIEAEMVAAPDRSQIDQTLQIVIGKQEIFVNFSTPPGRCVLAGVMADPSRPESGTLLIFSSAEIIAKP